jgi:hypothetical protein
MLNLQYHQITNVWKNPICITLLKKGALGTKLTPYFKRFNYLNTSLVVEYILDVIPADKCLVSFCATSALAGSNKIKWAI